MHCKWPTVSGLLFPPSKQEEVEEADKTRFMKALAVHTAAEKQSKVNAVHTRQRSE